MRIQTFQKTGTIFLTKCGYYDQLHFIKEFKEFAGSSAVSFYKKTPLPDENYRKQ